MKLCGAIKRIFRESKGIYGSPRVYEEMLKKGFKVSENTIAKYMQELGLDARYKKKFRVKTTDSNHQGPIAPRLFKGQESLPTAPHQILAGDITYLPYGTGFLYLAIVLDLYSRKVVGWSVTESLNTSGVMNALKMALQNCGQTAKIIFHSDRGVQYASQVFLDLLAQKEVIPSMSRKGNCYDHSFVESWFKSFKTEWLYRHPYETEKELRALVFQYIETWYNNKRLHSSLGYISPVEYENNHRNLR